MSSFPNWRFSEEDLERVKKVLASNFSSSRGTNYCLELEKLWAEKIGTKYAVVYTSGTTTLHAALHVLGVGKDDEVICPALNVIMTSNAVIFNGSVPVFADVQEDTFNVDPADIEKKITDKTKAIFMVPFYGSPCDVDEILRIGHEYNIPVIEDNAQAVGAKYKGKILGSLGGISSFSMESSKTIVTGQGGVCCTNDKDLYSKLRSFRFHGYRVVSEVTDPHTAKDVFQDPDYCRHVKFGWSYLLPEVACAIGVGQMERFDFFVNLRKEIGRMYEEVVDGSDLLVPQYVSKKCESAYWTFAAKFQGTKDEWRRFRKLYMANGGDGIYACFQVPYKEPVYMCPEPQYLSILNKSRRGNRWNCEVAERIQPMLMQFCSNYGSVEEAELKVEALRKAIKQWR